MLHIQFPLFLSFFCSPLIWRLFHSLIHHLYYNKGACININQWEFFKEMFPLVCDTFFNTSTLYFFSSCATLSNFSIHSNQFLKLYVLHERIRHRGVGEGGGGWGSWRISIFYASTSTTSSFFPSPWSLFPHSLLVSLRGKWMKERGWPLYSLEVIDQHFSKKKKKRSLKGNAPSMSFSSVQKPTPSSWMKCLLIAPC